MKNLFNIFSLVLIVLFCYILIPFNAYAGDNIPSNGELNYAKELNILIKKFDAKESQFISDVQKVKVSDQRRITNIFKQRFAYTKEYYLNIQALKTTSKFINLHRMLLVAVYNNLESIQKFISDLENGESLITIDKKYAAKNKSINENYKKSIDNFSQIINSWQKQFVQKVIPPNSK